MSNSKVIVFILTKLQLFKGKNDLRVTLLKQNVYLSYSNQIQSIFNTIDKGYITWPFHYQHINDFEAFST